MSGNNGCDNDHDLDNMQWVFGEWANATFPKSTPNSILAHFAREAVELVGADIMIAALEIEVYKNMGKGIWPEPSIGENTRSEAADCLLLLMHHAHKSGYSLQRAARDKFEMLKTRTWGEPDEQGVVEHVRIEDERKGN